MHAFEYAAPKSVKEAVSLLSKRKTVGVLAGGSDIIPQLREGRRDLDLLVDLKEIPELSKVEFKAATGLKVGAAAACSEIYENKDVAKRYPALVDCTSLIGSIQIQGRASLGGNLCNSSPAADTVPALIALGAVVTIVGPKGRRRVKVEDFCTGPGTNVLKKGEFVLSFQIPSPKRNSGAKFLRFIPRNEMDIAVVNAGASVVLDSKKKKISAARVCVGAAAPTALLLDEAAEAIEGEEVSDETIEKAAEIARKSVSPITDMRGTVEQRTHLAGVLIRRAIQGAVERARS